MLFLKRRIFYFFLILEPFWEALGAQAPPQKSPKVVQDVPKVDFGECLGRVFWGDFGRNLGGLWKDFERLLGGIWKGLGRVLGG